VRTNVLELILECRVLLESEVQQVDLVIEQAASSHGRDNQAVEILLQGRGRLQAQLDVIAGAVNRLRMIAEGKDIQPATSDTITPGMYAGMKLSVAAQAYFAQRGRERISCAKIVEDLTLAGVRQKQTRSKYHKNEWRALDTRDLRLLQANSPKRFIYDSTTDSMGMIPAPGNDTGWKRSRGEREQPDVTS
jgi:hypothetical protein